jgi:diacylglycerol kinase
MDMESAVILSPSVRLSVSASSPARPRRPWRAKFGDAFRGCKLGVRGHSSFSVHFFCAALVLASAWMFRCDLLQWCVLLGCIGMVLTAELFNSAIEALFHGQDEDVKRRNKAALDIAAGAVLVASIFAAIIGSLIFLARLWEIYVQSRPTG